MKRLPFSVGWVSCRVAWLVLPFAVFALGFIPAASASGDDPVVQFFLPELEAHAGEVLEVPFQIQSDSPLPMLSWTVEYDREVLEFLEPVLEPGIQALIGDRPPSEALFVWYLDPEDHEKGAACLQGAAPESPGWGKIKIEVKAEGDERLRIEVKELVGSSTLEVLLVDPEDSGIGLLGQLVTDEKGEGKLRLDEGDPLPFGAESVADLVGFAVRIQDPTETTVLAGTVPTLGVSVSCTSGEEQDYGWFQVSLVTDFLGREEFSIPADVVVDVARLRFRLLEDAPEGEYSLDFSLVEEALFEGEFHDGEKVVFNVVRVPGEPFDAGSQFEGASSVGLNNGLISVSIIGDIGILMRGDANHDGILDLSDPVRILSYLFVGGPPPTCLEVADVNLDSSIDISDSILLLTFLFFDETIWQPTTMGILGAGGLFDSPGGCL
jgi:hypothetical protein